MGIFSWFSTTSTKSSTAALIQTGFEVLAKRGLLESEPASLANRVVEAAFTRTPNLADLRFNKYVMATVALGMAPALPSFSPNEREASKHALGIVLKYIAELEMSNALSLTRSERETVERVQQLFLQSSKPSAEINIGSPPSSANAGAIDGVSGSGIHSSKSLNKVFTEDEVRKLRLVSIAVGNNAALQGYVDFAVVGSCTVAANIGVVTERGDQLSLGTLVKSLQDNVTTVSVRGLGGNRLPNAPDMFEDVNTAIAFMQPYFDFMSTKVSASLK